jgi:hypothetical protein
MGVGTIYNFDIFGALHKNRNYSLDVDEKMKSKDLVEILGLSKKTIRKLADYFFLRISIKPSLSINQSNNMR